MEMFQEIYLSNRDEWRNWLETNHESSKGIWMVFFKKETGKPTLTYDEFVEEALCFGWIDGLIKNLDEEKYLRKVMPRTDYYKWSTSNRERVMKLIANGRMTQFGLMKIGDYTNTGVLEWHEKKDVVAPQPFSPACLELLNQNKTALANYEKLSESHKKRYHLWVTSAKQEATQLKRMVEAVRLLEINHKDLLK